MIFINNFYFNMGYTYDNLSGMFLNSINVITMYIQIFQVNSTYSQLDDYIWRIRHENVIKNIKMLFINMYKIHQ